MRANKGLRGGCTQGMLSLTEPEFSQEMLFKDRNYGRLLADTFVLRSYILRL